MGLDMCLIDLVSGEVDCNVSSMQVFTSNGGFTAEKAFGKVFVVKTNSGYRSICSGSEYAGFFVWGSSSYTIWIPSIDKVSCWPVKMGFRRVCMNTYQVDRIKAMPPCYIVDKLSTLYMLPVIVTSVKPGGDSWLYNIISLDNDNYMNAVYESIKKYTIYHGLDADLSKILARIIASKIVSNELIKILRESLENNTIIFNSIDRDTYKLRIDERITITLFRNKLLIEEK